MYKRLTIVLFCLLTLGTIAPTGAFTSGDEAVGGVYLSPAATDNGQQYAEMGSNGQLRVEMTGLNANAKSVADDVFTIGTDLDRARVWIEDDQSAVTFYRMDTGGSIESSADAVELGRDETVSVGVEVLSGTDENVLESVKVRAEVPEDDDDDDSSTPRDSGGVSETPTSTPTETPTKTPESGAGAPPQGAASIETVELSVEPETVTVGETVRITGIVENVGDATGTADVEIVARGTAVAGFEADLAPGARATMTATTTFDEPGIYTVALGDESVTVRVETEEEQSFEIGGLSMTLIAILIGFVLLALLLFAYRYRRNAESPSA